MRSWPLYLALLLVTAFGSTLTPASAQEVAPLLAWDCAAPAGAKPGTVQIRKETILKVRPGLPPPMREPS